MPKARLVGNLALSFMTKAASGYWNVFDPTNGFTAIGRAALGQLRLDRLSKGYFFETDMLIQLYRCRAVVADVPMKTRYGSERSDLSLTRTFFTFPPRLARALASRLLWEYFISDFTACSAFLLSGMLLFTFGFVFGAYHWITGYLTHAANPTGTVMLAAVPLILGFQLLLQAAVLDIQNVPRVPLQRPFNGRDRL
jgi:hypothetical protein